MNAMPQPARSGAMPSTIERAATQAVVRRFVPPDTLREKILSAVLRANLRLTFKLFVGPPWPLAVQRGVTHALSLAMPSGGGVQITKTHIDGPAGSLVVERIVPRNVKPRHAILFMHGGAFCVGSPRTHRALTTRLAAMAQAEVLVPHYRRTPEAPFPAQIEDGVAAYRRLLADGYAPERIAIAGDSAGGSLTLLVPLALKQQGLPQPAALVLMSPLTDTTFSSVSMRQNQSLDPMLRKGWIEQAAGWYAAPHDHPLAAPLGGDLSGLPPALVQVGTDELLYDDSQRFTELSTQQGNRVELEIYEQRWHVFQIHAGLLSGSLEALKRQAAFLRRQWAR
jgi:acetyl esterase/lipase